MTLRMEAALRFSRLLRARVREPTGSPVEIYVSTMAVRISRSRLPMPAGVPIGPMPQDCNLLYRNYLRELQIQSRSFILGKRAVPCQDWHSKDLSASNSSRVHFVAKDAVRKKQGFGQVDPVLSVAPDLAIARQAGIDCTTGRPTIGPSISVFKNRHGRAQALGQPVLLRHRHAL